MFPSLEELTIRVPIRPITDGTLNLLVILNLSI